MERATQGRDYHIHLAAIVFTDIVGYSRMMEDDADRTIAVLERHNAIVLPLVEQNGGEVIDAIGDGLFLLFPSVRAAVDFSLAVQRTVAEHDSAAAGGDRFLLRIGIHIGEVRRKDGKAFGNGVNIAARIQPFARPGGVCISDDAVRQLSAPRQVDLHSIGTPELKNISRRIELHQIITGNEVEADAADSGVHGELDAIKQQILEERAKMARRRDERARNPRESLEQRIEGSVYAFVERTMDTALRKFDEMPEEKKARMSEKLESEGRVRGGGRNVVIDLGSSDTRSKVSVRNDGRRGGSDIGFGAAVAAGFGFGHFFLGYGWMLWPFLLLGILPLGSGLAKWWKRRAHDARARRQRSAELERALLQSARELGGRLTVVQAASLTHRPLDEVQEALESMTAKGYVVQNVRDSGVVEFEFPSLAGE